MQPLTYFHTYSPVSEHIICVNGQHVIVHASVWAFSFLPGCPLTHIQICCEGCVATHCVPAVFPDDSRLRFSSRRVAVTVGSLLDDQHWHSVHVERFNKQVNLTVDSHSQHFQTKGEGHSLEVDYEVSAQDDEITQTESDIVRTAW